jgi:cyanophycinase
VVGGSSAGLAVQGEFAFVALQGGIVSADALDAPMDSSVSLSRDFLAVNQPWMRGVVTDTHFFQRDRMGRLVTFVARVAEAGWPRDDNQSNANPGVLGVGLSEHTAVVVDRSGIGKFVGVGPAYFVRSAGRVPTTCVQGRHLSWTGKGVDVWRWNSSDATTDSQWDFKSWDPSPAQTGTQYALTVKGGVLESSQPGGSIY